MKRGFGQKLHVENNANSVNNRCQQPANVLQAKIHPFGQAKSNIKHKGNLHDQLNVANKNAFGMKVTLVPFSN